jgi:hypothetical protein
MEEAIWDFVYIADFAESAGAVAFLIRDITFSDPVIKTLFTMDGQRERTKARTNMQGTYLISPLLFFCILRTL